MGTLATYGLFRDWYFVVPDGRTIYWAIPIGHRFNDEPEILYSELRQGNSVGNERAVLHEKVVGYVNAQPFQVDGIWYASSFSWEKEDAVYSRDYGTALVRSTFEFQAYENGYTSSEYFEIIEGKYYYDHWSTRSEGHWEFNGSLSTTSSDVRFCQYGDAPEYVCSRGTSRRSLRAYWTGIVNKVSYNWPVFIAQLLNEHPCEVNFSNLIVEAADQMHYSANNADNVRQFFDIASSLVNVLTGSAPKKVLKRILQGTSSPRAFGRELKELSQSAWLTNRYVINTTKSDIEDFIDKVGRIDAPVKEGEHIVRAGESDGEWTCHIKIRSRDVKQNALAETHRWAMEHGFALTPANLWDMVPFSFMVDWFIPVGDTLKIADAEFYFHSAYYEILSYTSSRKYTARVKDSGNVFYITHYERSVSSKVPIISSLTYEDPTTRSVRNRVIDASAIFL